MALLRKPLIEINSKKILPEHTQGSKDSLDERIKDRKIGGTKTEGRVC